MTLEPLQLQGEDLTQKQYESSLGSPGHASGHEALLNSA